MAKTRDATRDVPAGDPRHGPLSAVPTLSQVWVALAVGLPVVMLLATRMPAVDLAYLVRAGEEMLRSHHVLRTDTFTFTVGGHPWLNQQWGSEVLLAAVYRLGGWPLLMMLRAAAGA